MLDTIRALLGGAPKNELARHVLNIPRYTGDQLLYSAREEANAYLKRLQETTLDYRTVDAIKNVLRRPLEDAEDAEALQSDMNDIFEDFFLSAGFDEPSPIYVNRWHLALMNKSSYVMCLNALNNVNQRFQTARSQWVQSQLAAIQMDLEENIEQEVQFMEATEDLLSHFDGEPGEA